MQFDPPLMVRSHGITDVGRKRSGNEDAFVICEDQQIYAVADGMGGAAAGEVASRLLVEAVREAASSGGFRTRVEAAALVRGIFARANSSITAHTRSHPECQGMGCTAEVLLIGAAEFVIGHVGDSRTYLMRERRLTQLTRDHSWVQEQIDSGRLSRDQARGHRLAHLITRAVGTDDPISVDLISGRAAPGDCFLLCSDGLVDMVTDEAIERILATDVAVARKTEELVATANAHGGHDNITAVMVELFGGGKHAGASPTGVPAAPSCAAAGKH